MLWYSWISLLIQREKGRMEHRQVANLVEFSNGYMDICLIHEAAAVFRLFCKPKTCLGVRILISIKFDYTKLMATTAGDYSEPVCPSAPRKLPLVMSMSAPPAEYQLRALQRLLM